MLRSASGCKGGFFESARKVHEATPKIDDGGYLGRDVVGGAPSRRRVKVQPKRLQNNAAERRESLRAEHVEAAPGPDVQDVKAWVRKCTPRYRRDQRDKSYVIAARVVGGVVIVRRVPETGSNVDGPA